MNHPFLKNTFHVRWSQLQPDSIEADMTEALIVAQERLDTITEQDLATVTFESSLLALENATEDLSRAWGYVSHLDSVCNSDALRIAYNAMLPAVTEFYTKIPLNADLWKVLNAFAATDEAAGLNSTQRRFLEETLADFKESGANLSDKNKKKLESINAKLSQATQKYSENVLDSTNAWELIIEDLEKLKGLPQSAMDAAKQSAEQKGIGSDDKPKWRFTLQMPSLLPVLKYLDDDGIRQTIWQASTEIAAKDKCDNEPLIAQILKIRHDKAKLLGKSNFADFILSRRMARDGETALNFIEDLHHRISDTFGKDLEQLEAYKAEKTHSPIDRLQPWEISYWAEKLRMERYNLDEEELRPYFPIEKVINGMFELVERIYGVKFKQRSTVFIHTKSKEETRHEIEGDLEAVEVWHPEVQFYEIYDQDNSHLGSFYADWHPRETKRGGAWMNHFVTGSPQADGTFSPHLGIMCGNLSPSVKGKPALMTHDEVGTIFHEFGHLLHHLLGKVEIKSLNGVNVAWDFVELPSQFMENWTWEREALDIISSHVETGEPLPDALLKKMLDARNYMEASMTMRQLSLAKMDLELHMHYENNRGKDLEAVIAEAIDGYVHKLKTTPPSIIRRFGHLFSESTGYAAGYYSYKWAEVLDADAFTRFKKEGILNPQTGREFREKILSKGNSAAPETLYRDFMGRDPDLTALLNRAGLD